MRWDAYRTLTANFACAAARTTVVAQRETMCRDANVSKYRKVQAGCYNASLSTLPRPFMHRNYIRSYLLQEISPRKDIYDGRQLGFLHEKTFQIFR